MKPIFSFITLTLCMSCTHKVYLSDQELEAKHFSYLRDSVTTKEDIVIRYGEPNWIFENGRIFTYRLYVDEKEALPKLTGTNKKDSTLSYWPTDAMRQFSLVLVFKNDLLEKHHLISLVK